MTKCRVFFLISFLFCVGCPNIYSQCVSCQSQREKRVFFCVSSASGAVQFATSTGQTQCALTGVCGAGIAGQSSCKAATIGNVSLDRNVTESLSNASTLYADAVSFASANGVLGSKFGKVYFFPDYKEREKTAGEFLMMDRPEVESSVGGSVSEGTEPIEFVFEVIEAKDSPSAIRISLAKRIDRVPDSIELGLRPTSQQRGDNAITEWIVSGWKANQ